MIFPVPSGSAEGPEVVLAGGKFLRFPSLVRILFLHRRANPRCVGWVGLGWVGSGRVGPRANGLAKCSNSEYVYSIPVCGAAFFSDASEKFCPFQTFDFPRLWLLMLALVWWRKPFKNTYYNLPLLNKCPGPPLALNFPRLDLHFSDKFRLWNSQHPHIFNIPVVDLDSRKNISVSF